MPEPKAPRPPRADRPASGRRRPSRAAKPAVPATAPEGERLQRVLARAGLGSRRSVEELVVEGRVRINGKLAELGNRVVASRDQITVDDVAVPADPGLMYLAVNKPRGVTTTLRDKHAARTVAELVPPGSPRLVPVGRLDRDSEGLLLMTNDGDLAHRLQHPRFGVQKEYLVEVPGNVPPNVVRRLVEGIELDEGVARALRARISAKGKRRSAVTLVMGEGRKREIRRMFSALGLHVERLVRVRFGPVRLGRLGPGEVRPLDVEEVRDLYKVTELRRARRG